MYLDTGLPQLLGDLHTLLEHTSETLTTESHDISIDLAAAESVGFLLTLKAGLCDGEDTIDTERDTDTGNLSLGHEHAHQVIVATTGSNTANT